MTATNNAPSAAHIADHVLMTAIRVARQYNVPTMELAVALSAALTEIIDSQAGNGAYLRLIESATQIREQLRNKH